MKYSGSVRADLVGGTLDLYPLNYILENVVTINVALSLKSCVEIQEDNFFGVEIIAQSYQTSLKLDLKDFSKNNFFKNGFNLSGSVPTNSLVPTFTVSGRSVLSRNVIHGTPNTVASSVIPPESVITALLFLIK